ncbi:MAG: cell division protein FtsZ, partial [Prevotella sp.]|nr:cell division protein FtsZ [Prevotella sp.]
YGEGEDRVKKAIDDALNSPLLNDNDIFNSKKILLNISFSHQKDSKDNFMMEEMNYVHEFMDRFGSDFVFKWGVAVDPELGKQVKVTILATGFGMQNVDGMEERLQRQQTREEATRLAEEQERAAKREERRSHFYNDTDKSHHYKRRPNIYIFTAEDLDNDNVISAVEQTPTYKRTKEVLASIGNQNTTPEATRYEQPDTTPGVISFV